MRLELTIAIGSLLIAGCSSTGQGSVPSTVTETPTASPTQPATGESAGITEAATADDVVQRLKSEGLCEDPGDIDPESIGEHLVAACGSPVPFVIADAPFDGQVAAGWCNNASALTKKTVWVIKGSNWAIIHPMPTNEQIRAIADAVGGTPARLSQAC